MNAVPPLTTKRTQAAHERPQPLYKKHPAESKSPYNEPNALPIPKM
jgi:hypothetical protein